MTTDQALQSLLEGSGLVSSRADIGAVVLFAPAQAAQGASQGMEGRSGPGVENRTTLALDTLHVEAPVHTRPVRSASFDFYGRRVQAEVVKALRQDAETRRRRYDLRLSLRIGAAGEVDEATLLSSTGNDDLDEAILDVVREVVFARPPVDMPQPVRISAEVR